MYFWWGAFFSHQLLVGSKKLGSHRTFGGFELFSVLLVGSHRIFGGFELFSVLLVGSHRTSLAFTSPAFVSLAFVSLAIVSLPFVSLAFVLLAFVSLAFISLAFVSLASLSSLRGSLPSPHRFFTCTLLAVASPFILLAPGIGTFPPLLHLHSSCTFHLHSFHLLPSPVWLLLSSLRGSVPSPHRFFTCTLLAVASLAFPTKSRVDPPKVHAFLTTPPKVGRTPPKVRAFLTTLPKVNFFS